MVVQWNDILLLLMTGFFSSVHCVGMCGAIVLGCAGTRDAAGDRRGSVRSNLPVHLAYHAGRITSYALLGAVAGSFGGSLARLHNAGGVLSIVLGAVLVLAGIGTTGVFRGVTARLPVQRLAAPVTRFVRRLAAIPDAESRLYLGLLTPFLPCGVLYAVVLKSAGAGSTVGGALSMLAFGIGMMPALLLTGVSADFLTPRLRLAGRALTALLFVLMGATMLMRGMGMPLPWMRMMH